MAPSNPTFLPTLFLGGLLALGASATALADDPDSDRDNTPVTDVMDPEANETDAGETRKPIRIKVGRAPEGVPICRHHAPTGSRIKRMQCETEGERRLRQEAAHERLHEAKGQRHIN